MVALTDITTVMARRSGACALLLLLSAFAAAQIVEVAEVSDESGLRAAWNDANIQVIRFTADIALTDSLPVRAAGDVIVTGSPTAGLDGNGHGCFHTRNISFGVRELTIRGCDGQARNTEAAHDGGAILFEVDDPALPMPARLRVVGSEIRENQALSGGAIRVVGGSAELFSLRLIDNEAINRGGAISVESAGITLLDSELSGNRALAGGAIATTLDGRLVMADTQIVENRATFGGGIAAEDGAEIDIEHSEISANQAGFDGAGLWIVGSSLRIDASSINRNQSGALGGGLGLLNGAEAELTNVTVSGNSADTFRGGGIHLLNARALTLRFATVYENRSTQDGQQLAITGSGAIEIIASVVGDAAQTDGPASIRPGAVPLTVGFSLLGSVSDPEGLDLDAASARLAGLPAGLSALQRSDSLTELHLPNDDSPLIARIARGQAGCGDLVTRDQRGRARAADGVCTIGSVERLSPTRPVPTLHPFALLVLALGMLISVALRRGS
ncbi:MAG: hypothetical protein RQ729_06985 [Wenzhouxiangellaceae bacterium]|nr:hypothetical protein [Wenzhouxiangellaceae bacterium]